MKNIVLSLTDKEQNENIGGKAKNLIKLGKFGFNVPKWAVIPQTVLLNQLPDNINESNANEIFQKLKVPVDILNELKSYFDGDVSQKTFAVRSSAIDEDGANYSFAGQFETFLNVNFSEIEIMIKNIWKSVISDRVLNYRKKNFLEIQFGIGVIIQEMINADVSGVGFGINPVNNDKNSKVISAVFGLGEGLVSGELDADTFLVMHHRIEEIIAPKTYSFVLNHFGNGVVKQEIESERQKLPCLNHFQIKEISSILEKLNAELGVPQDIEFAYQNNNLYLLQTRPITTLKAKTSGEYTIWDNSNIIESYPGITTPLTFSFIIKMYEAVYRQFVSIMGVSRKSIDIHKEIFANTLGLVRGRVYYNLLNWYKMLAMLPGYSINAENMERMMGVKERFDLDEAYRMNKNTAIFRIVLMVIKMFKMHFSLPKERKKFIIHLNNVIDEYKSINFRKLTPYEIIEYYINFESSLLLKWKAPLTNDFFAMIWLGILKKQTEKLCPSEINFHNDLLCGSQDIISVEPIHRTMEIAKIISENDETKKLFINYQPDFIWNTLISGKFSEIKIKIDDYFEKFGNRCVGELKLETISYSENPTLFIKILKSYVEQKIINLSNSKIEDELRISAETIVFNALKKQPLRLWWFKYVLAKTRDVISNRENLRFQRTRGFGMVRTMFGVLGKLWQEAGNINNPRDIYYIELDEIKKMQNNFNPEIKQKIAERRIEFESYENQKIPLERFFSYGDNFDDMYIYSAEKNETAQTDLSGIGCCPGIVKGKVRVVTNPNEIDSLNGDILVTKSTDPGWVNLFPTTSAIIVEKGSLLSHSAIVAREMGIPCIVSVSGLLRTLKTGDEIQMNGSTGKIVIISK